MVDACPSDMWAHTINVRGEFLPPTSIKPHGDGGSSAMPPSLFCFPPPRPVPPIVTTATAVADGRLAMAINLRSHAFAGSPLRAPKPSPPFQSLEDLALDDAQPNLRVLPFAKGRPLAVSLSEQAAASDAEPRPLWHLGWLTAEELRRYLGRCGVALGEVGLVYLGSKDRGPSYWAAEVPASAAESGSPVMEGGGRSCFVELRTLMVATDWTDEPAMGELAVAGRGKALLEWHNTARFCGHCGAPTKPIDVGRRKQCTNELCKKRVYPRVDPVVIMLVIDKENDRALLSHLSRFVPRMWSCLAGFMEPGESLEEAVRRETWEETGIEVDEVVYHSSQPWPVGPNSMPCQLMVGFFAYAKTLEISVDKDELEDAQWHRREDVKKALTFAEYKKAQTTAAAKVDQMCKGVERKQSLSSDFNVESGELAPMFVPGPFAIAHHLISSWVYQINPNGEEPQPKQGASVSNL